MTAAGWDSQSLLSRGQDPHRYVTRIEGAAAGRDCPPYLSGSRRRIGPRAVRPSTTVPRWVTSSCPASARSYAAARTEAISARQPGGSSLRATSEGHIVVPGRP